MAEQITKKKFYSILIAELAVAILFIYQLFQIILIRSEIGSFTLSFEQDPVSYVFLGLTGIVLVSIYLIISKKFPEISNAHKGVGNLIKISAKTKLIGAKDDSRVLALLLLQFIFVMVIVVSIALYLDPETNIIGFPWNIIGFVIFVAGSFWLYSYTKFFRIK